MNQYYWQILRPSILLFKSPAYTYSSNSLHVSNGWLSDQDALLNSVTKLKYMQSEENGQWDVNLENPL